MYLPGTVKELRKASEMSQEQLMIDLAMNGVRVSRQTISGWESGESIPDANAIAALAIVFNKPIKHFFASNIK